MTTTGGISTLKGVQYEIQAVLYEMPALLEGRLVAIRYQPATSALSPDQPPAPVFADDYATQDNAGGKRFFQAKQNTKDASWTISRLIAEGVLSQFWDQHGVEPHSALLFVSNISAPELEALAEHARQSISSGEFEKTWTKTIERDTNKVTDKLGITVEDVWRLLRTVEYLGLTESHIEERIADYASDRYNDVDKFALVLKDLIQKSPSQLLTRDTVVDYLEARGLFHLPGPLPQDIPTILRQASGSLRSYKCDIFDIHIERDEAASLEQWIQEDHEEHTVAFLVDEAGSGKSVILHDLLERLERRAIPVLAIKGDLLSGVTDADSLQSALSLPASPESLLSAAVQHGRAVLLVDQLDALSLTFARNQACLDAVIGLVGRACSIAGVRVIVSCRTFDRKFDPKLRQIQSDREFGIKPLSRLQVQPVLSRLDVKWENLTSREQELLANPLHLALFAEIIDESNKRGERYHPATCIQDLYDTLWNLKVLHSNVPSIRTDELQDAVYRLVDAVHRSQELCQPVVLLDSMIAARDYLESEGLLRRQGGLLTFFHQSFFDYCYARRFALQDVSLADTVRRGRQGFFVRPQIIRTLSYLREVDGARYLRELNSLMDRNKAHEWLRQLKKRPGKLRRFAFAAAASTIGRPIRYHLRDLVFAWFGQQTNLTDEEKGLGLSCLHRRKDRHLLLLGARGNAEWFDSTERSLANLLNSPDRVLNEDIVPFLCSVQEVREKEVFGLLRNQLGVSEEWNNRIIWCLNSHEVWKSSEAETCLVWLCENQRSPWHSLGIALHRMANANPALGCRVLKIILHRLRDQWLETPRPPDATRCPETQVLDDGSNTDAALQAYLERMRAFDKHAEMLLPRPLSWMDELVSQAADACPAVLVETILTWLERVLPDVTWNPSGEGWLQDELFSSRFVSPFHDPESAIIQGVHRALSRLAAEDREQFLACAVQLERSRYLVFHQILADILREHAAHYASWACEYLLNNTLRFHIEGPGSSTLYSRKLIGAVFPHLSIDERARLEEAVLSYYPAWEQKVENLSSRGFSQLELLWGIPDSLLTPKGQLARRELQRKFPRHELRERQRHELLGWVGSPIPEERTEILTDDAWLNAMAHYDDETGWDRRREALLKGGVVELSRQFEKVVEREPERFAKLAMRFDESISSQYFGALLRGLAESTASSATVFAICDRFAQMRPNDTTVEAAICDAVEKRVGDNVPESLIELVRNIALTSADPDHEAWQVKAGEDSYCFDGDPHFNGINTTRGKAVRVHMRCMLEAPPLEIESFMNTLEKIAGDPSSAVRSCLIEGLPYVLRFDSDRVVGIFETAVKGRRELSACRVSHNFIHHALARHASRMLEHIAALGNSKDDEVRETCGRLATLAYFNTPEAKSLYRQCLGGDPALRRGVATVLARNVAHPRLLKQCLAGLGRLCDDSDSRTRINVGEAFRYLPSPTWLSKRFTVRLLHSRTGADAAEALVDYATRIRLEDPELALDIAEQTTLALGNDIVDIQKAAALVDKDLVSLTVAIHTHTVDRSLQARALDLFERVMDLGSRYAKEALKAAER